MNETPYLPGLEPSRSSVPHDTSQTDNVVNHNTDMVDEPEDILRTKSLAELREDVINCAACNQLGFYVRCDEHKHIPF